MCLLRKCTDGHPSYLRPGTGYVEHIELDWTPRCVEGYTFPHQANELAQWWRDMRLASRRLGKPIDCPTDIEQLMERCGLTDVTHMAVRVPLREPPIRGEMTELTKEEREELKTEDDKENRLLWGFKMAVSHPFPNGRVPLAFEGLTMSLFTRQLQMQAPAVAQLCDRLRAIVNLRDLPLYLNLYVTDAFGIALVRDS